MSMAASSFLPDPGLGRLDYTGAGLKPAAVETGFYEMNETGLNEKNRVLMPASI